jgi:hypothetical protein
LKDSASYKNQNRLSAVRFGIYFVALRLEGLSISKIMLHGYKNIVAWLLIFVEMLALKPGAKRKSKRVYNA